MRAVQKREKRAELGYKPQLKIGTNTSMIGASTDARHGQWAR